MDKCLNEFGRYIENERLFLTLKREAFRLLHLLIFLVTFNMFNK